MTDKTVSKKRRLPDLKICQTRYLERSPVLLECLVEKSDACKYAVRFYASVFCRHPQRRSFEKTDQALMSVL